MGEGMTQMNKWMTINDGKIMTNQQPNTTHPPPKLKAMPSKLRHLLLHSNFQVGTQWSFQTLPRNLATMHACMTTSVGRQSNSFPHCPSSQRMDFLTINASMIVGNAQLRSSLSHE
jgi:hypothetical protein